jgi:hypothetical protein
MQVACGFAELLLQRSTLLVEDIAKDNGTTFRNQTSDVFGSHPAGAAADERY